MATPAPERATPLDSRTRLLWLGIREGLLAMLRAVETYLGVERSYESSRRQGRHGEQHDGVP